MSNLALILESPKIFTSLRRVADMGEIRINVTNFLTIGLMSFVAVYVINKGLEYAGKPQYKA